MTLLFAAMLFDVFKRQIPNGLILVGVFVELMYQALVDGAEGIFQGVVRLGLFIPVLFLFFQCSVVGAGDLKLISIMSLVLSWGELGRWLCISICLGLPIGIVYRLRGQKSFPFGVPLFIGMVGTQLIK